MGLGEKKIAMRANNNGEERAKTEETVGRVLSPSLFSLLSFFIRSHRNFVCAAPLFLNA